MGNRQLNDTLTTGDAGDRDADAGRLVVDARSGGLAQDATKSSARASILIMPVQRHRALEVTPS
jgi:hypothetical protein